MSICQQNDFTDIKDVLSIGKCTNSITALNSLEKKKINTLYERKNEEQR